MFIFVLADDAVVMLYFTCQFLRVIPAVMHNVRPYVPIDATNVIVMSSIMFILFLLANSLQDFVRI